jgi:Putative addiction module component
MSRQQLTQEAMSLPLPEKVSLAQALWESIDAGVADSDERSAAREAARRDEELSAGAVVGRTHKQAMQAARRAIGCD